MDFPRSTELFELEVVETVAHDSSITIAACRTEGTDVNALLHAGNAVGDELVYQTALVSRDRSFGTAQGDALDEMIFSFFGLKRLAAAQASATLVFTHTNTALVGVIPVGTTVSTADGVQFATLSQVSFVSGDATKSVVALNTTAGSIGNVKANNLVSWQPLSFDPAMTVSNPAVAAGGSDRETDDAFRARARGFWRVAQKGTLDAVVFGATQVSGVSTARVDEVGFYAHTGDTIPVALNTVLTASDSQGNMSGYIVTQIQSELNNWRPCGVYVEVASGVPVMVTISVTFDYRAGYDTVVTDQRIRQAILDYVNSLRVGQTMLVGVILNICQKDQGVATQVNPSCVPSNDVVPSTGQVIRVESGSIFCNGN